MYEGTDVKVSEGTQSTMLRAYGFFHRGADASHPVYLCRASGPTQSRPLALGFRLALDAITAPGLLLGVHSPADLAEPYGLPLASSLGDGFAAHSTNQRLL